MAFKYSIPLPLGMVLATVMSLSIAQPGRGAESIIVRYKADEVTVTRQDLDTFAKTGEMPPNLEKLLGSDVQVPGVVRSLLKEEIKIPRFVERFLKGSNGDFLLLKLDEAISSTSGNTEQDLNGIRTAFLDSIADQRVSFIELINKHPQRQIQVDLTSLEGTYKDVRGFVERVLPAIEVAKGVLQDLICDCDSGQSAAASRPGPSKGSNYQSIEGTAPLNAEECNDHKRLEKPMEIKEQ